MDPSLLFKAPQLTKKFIAMIREVIISNGFDPYVVKNYVHDTGDASLPYFRFKGHLKNLTISGFSNISLNKLSVDMINSEIIFDISLPKLTFNFGDVGATLNVFDSIHQAKLKGSLSVMQIRFSCKIKFDESFTTMNFDPDIYLHLGLSNIKSELSVIYQQTDYSECINDFLGLKTVQFLKKHQEKIDKALSDLALKFVAAVKQEIMKHFMANLNSARMEYLDIF